jgi:hypothetical protein
MRTLVLLVCAIVATVALAGVAAAQTPDTGVLSVERARGSLLLELRGSLLGRLGSGTLRVTDLTPRDRFDPIVTGRKVSANRLGPRTVVYHGQGLRFRMVGGRYRIAVRGSGVSVSAVGRGWVVLDGEPKLPFDDVGVYSLEDGVDCGLDPDLCLPLPIEPERFAIGAEEPAPRKGTP